MLQITEICLFCCKSKSLFSEVEIIQDGKKKSVKKCLELLQRYFDMSFLTLKDLDLVLSRKKVVSNSRDIQNEKSKSEKILSLEYCDSCMEIVDAVNSLIHQLKCVQLKLEWKLDTLLKIMRMGGKVHSRQKVLKSVFNAKHRMTGNDDADDVADTKKEKKISYKRFVRLRREIIRKCSNATKSKNIYPKVLLIKEEFPDTNAIVKIEQTSIETALPNDEFEADLNSYHFSNQLENSNKMEYLDTEYKVICFCLVILMICYNYQENPLFANYESMRISHHDDDHHQQEHDSNFSLHTDENNFTIENSSEGKFHVDFVADQEGNIVDVEKYKFTASIGNEDLLKEAEIKKEENVFKGMYREESCTMVWNDDLTNSSSTSKVTKLEDGTEENSEFDTVIVEGLKSNKKKRTTHNDNLNADRKRRRNKRQVQPSLNDLRKYSFKCDYANCDGKFLSKEILDYHRTKLHKK